MSETTNRVVGDSLSNYVIEKNKVYYIDRNILKREVKEADVSTFEILGYSYAKDSKNVYCYGEIFEGADAKTFRKLDDHD